MSEEEIKEDQEETDATDRQCDVAGGEDNREQEEKKEKTDKRHKNTSRELETKLLTLESENEKLKEELKGAEDKYLRLYAEYENFRKRTAKEKEGIYGDAYSDAVTEVLPIADTLEIAAECEGDKVVEGVRMTLKQFTETLKKLGIEEIQTVKGDEFDPGVHNAVMSEDDGEVKTGCVVRVLRKGYRKGDKVIRYAMVSVAN